MDEHPMSERPLVGCTMGDPAGIGPEIVLTALCEHPEVAESVLVLGDAAFLGDLAADLAVEARLTEVEDPGEARGALRSGEMGPFLYSCAEVVPEVMPGAPRPSDGRAALECIRAGASLATSGVVDGLVTAPVSKKVIAMTEPGFVGHTEYLATRAGVSDPLMVFLGPEPAVALLTTHLPLATAVTAVRRQLVLSALRRLDSGWQRWLGGRPRIGVAGLNPHAGEGGMFGRDEDREIRPAIVDAKKDGILVSGPYAADSIFREPHLDAVLCMYHDQGTLMAKRASKVSVNVTFGLPYPRTSPDHGVAYAIAGEGLADPEALIAALDMGIRLAARR